MADKVRMLLQAQIHKDAIENIKSQLNTIQAGIEPINIKIDTSGAIKAIKDIDGVTSKINTVTTKTWEDASGQVYKYTQTLKNLEKGLTIVDTYMKNTQGQLEYMGRTINDKSMEMNYKAIEKAHAEALKMNKALDDTIVKNHQLAKDTAWKQYFQSITETSDEIKKLNQYYKLLEDNRPMHVIHAEALKMNKAFDEQIAKAKTLKGVYTELKGEQQSASNVAKILSEAYGGLEIRGQSLNRVNGQYSVTLKQSAKENLVLKGAIDQVTGALYVQSESVSRARNIQMGFWEQMKEALKKVPIWMGATTVFFQSVRFVTGTIKEIKDLNKELIALERVTTASRIEIEAFYKQAPTAARQLGVLTSEVINTTAEISKLGYSLSEAQYLTRLGLVGKTVGDLDNVKDSVDYLTATVKGFRLEVEETESILDYMNHTANTTSINFRAIGEGFKRMSASLAEGGNTIQESMGMLVAGFDIVRNAELVATSLRTTSMRIRGVSEDGEDLSGLIPKLESKFNKFGLSLKKDNDTFKSTFEILKSISSVWKDLTDMERADLLEDLAGKRNVQTIAGIINNMEMAIDVSERFEESQGSAIIEHQRYMEGVEAAQNRFLSSMTELHNKLLQSDTIVWFYNFTSAIVDNISALGKWNIAILATTGLLFAFISATKKVILADTTLKVMSMGSAFSTLLTSLPGVIKGMFGLKSGIDATAASAGMLNIATGGIIIGIGLLAQGVGHLINRQKRLREEMEENLTAFQEQSHISKSLDSLIKSYEDLAKKTNKTAEEQEKLINIKEQIIALLPKAKNRIDNENLSLKEQVEILKELNKEELERAKNKARQAIIDYGASYDKDVERLELVNMLIRHYNRELANMDKSRHSPDFDAKKYEQLNKSLKKYTKESEELAERIEAVDKAHEILDTTLEKTSSDVEDLIDSLDKYDSTLLDLESDINSLVKTLTELEEMQDKVASGYSYSYTEIQKIKEAYPELEDAIYRTAKGWSIEQSAIENLRKEQINQAETQMKSQVEMKRTAIEQTKERISLIIKEIEAVKNLASAYSLAAQLGQKSITSAFGKTEVDMVAGSTSYQDYLRRMGSRVVSSTKAISILSEEQYNIVGRQIKEVMTLGHDIEDLLKLESEIDKLLSNVTSGRVSGGAADKASKSAKSAKEEYQAIADLYLKINLELEKNNQLLARNKTMQELAVENSQEHFDLIRKENELYKERQNLLHQLANLQRAEMKALESELLVHGFTFTGEGDNRIITNLDNIKGKTKEVEEAFNRYIEIQSKLIPGLQQDWWDLQVSIVGNTGKIRDAIQALIEDLESLKDELEDFDFAEQMRDLNEQLETAKFTHWIENIILGLERLNDKSELLSFKLSLFDEEDYENRANVIADLYQASQEKLQGYREEWNKLAKITPKNANEAQQLANAMKQVQQGMRDAFVATRDYHRQLEKLQVDAISNEFEKANKQLELQLSIIDHNIKQLQDGILPDFTLDMVIPIPDFSEIFDETKSENEKIYNEQVELEEQIRQLKKQSLAMQLQEAEAFYREEMNKLMEHYNELLAKIAEKEAEIAELRDFLNEEQKKQLKAIQKVIKLLIEEFDKSKEKAEKEHGKAIEDEKLEHYNRLLRDLGLEWLNPEYEAIDTHQLAVEYITNSHLLALQSSYSTAWSNIVSTVSSAVSSIMSMIAQANAAVASMGSGGGGGGAISVGTKTVKVNPDGKAPKGLSVGTVVETAGGDYKITKVKSDGSYESIKLYADGTEGHPGGKALVGEKGKEIAILPSGRAIILGKYGGELVDLPCGTHVVPHEETKEILKHTGDIDNKKIFKYEDGTIPKYAGGILGGLLGVGSTISKVVSNVVSSVGDAIKDTVEKTTKTVEKEIDYSYRNEKWEIPEGVGMMSTRDLHDYVTYKLDADREFKETGVWNKKYSEGAQALRDKYGITEDEYSYGDLSHVRANIIFGDFLHYGLTSDNPENVKKAIKIGAINDYWDMPDDDYGTIEPYSRKKRPERGIGGGFDFGGFAPSYETPKLPPTLNELIGIDKPDFLVEMSKEFKEGTGKYSEGLFELLGFEGYDKYLEERKDTLEEIAKLQSDYLKGTDDQISKEEILAKIDKQLLEDARTQSWLRVDLLEQMQRNVEEYSNTLKEKYDEALASSDTELARQIFEEYNASLTQQLQIEQQIQQAIKQRYDMEFALLDRHIAKQKQYQSSLEKTLELITITDSENKEEILRLNDEIIKSEIEQRNILRDSIAEFSKQLDLLLVGSSEWNILNDKVKEYEINLIDANIAIEKAIKQRYDMEFALLDKKLAKEEQNKSFLDKELKYAQTEHPDNYERQQIIQEEILKIEERKNTIQEESLESILKQRDALAVGSYEWNLLNDRADELKFSILDSNQAILDMQNSILDTNFNGLLSGLDEFSKKMDNLEYELQLKQILNPDDVDGISAIYDKMTNVSSSQIDSLYVIVNQLRDQQGLLDSTSSQWGVIGSQIDDVVAKIKAANLALAQQAKDSFGKYLGGLGDKVTSSNPEPSSPTQAKDDSDKWLDGREKELEIQKMMNYIEENGIKLTKEQLKLLNSKGKIRKSELNILQKELELQQLQVKLENLRNQKTIQQLTKREDGTWDFTYVADEDAIRDTENQMIDAELSVIDAKKSLEKELAQEAEDAMQNAYESAKKHYEAQMELLDKTLNEAENRMYKSAEEFRKALESIDLDLPIDEMVEEYWEYFLKTATIFINEALDITKLNLKSHLKEFEEAGNTAGQGYAQGLLDSIDEIMSGEGDIIQKQQAIIDMLASEYSEFALAGNKNGMSFINGLISSMETVDYQYSANEMSGKIVQAMEERLKELEGTGQDAGRALIEGLLASMEDIENNGDIENKLLAILALFDKTNEYGTLGQALGKEFMQGLTDTITNISDEVSGEGEGALSEALNTMVAMLDSKIANFAEKGDIQGLAYAEALKIKLQEGLENAKLTQTDIIDLLSEFKDFDLAGLLSGKAYDESLTEGLGKAEDNVDKSSSAIIKGLDEDVEKFGDVGKAQGEAYKNAIVKSFENAVEKAKSIVGDLVKYINSQSFNIDVSVDGKTPDGIQSFDSGGYTGRSQGLAWLDEKELILNKIDTSNLLKAIDVTRDLFSNSNALSVPQLQTASAGSGGQVFHIDKLEFPNVRDAREIEGAIKNLSTYATQWANRN